MGVAFEVLSIFKAKDQVSDKYDLMGRNANKFGKKSEKAFKKAGKAAKGFGNITKGILAAGGIQKGMGLVSQGLTSVATDFLDFDNAVLSASAKFKGLDLSTQKGIDTLNKLKKTAREVGADTEFNAAQAASGLDFLALASFSADQAMALLPGVTNLATVAQVDLATATDIASDSLGAFGLMTDDTEQLTKNFKRVQDVLAKTTATSNTNITDLFETIKSGAASFTATGGTMETFAALAGTMANSGLKGSKAGLVMKNMMVRLAKQSPKTEKMMKFLNLKIDDSKGGFADSTIIIDRFNAAIKNLTPVQQQQAKAQIFGTEILTGMTILLKAGGNQLRSYRQRLIDAEGAAESMAKVMRSSLINRLASLGSAATEVGFQLFSAFSEKGADSINTLTQFVRGIDLKPFIETIKTVSKFGGEMFDKFTAFGESSGLFDSIKSGLISLKPHFDTIIDIVKTMFKFFKEVGIFDAMVIALKLAIGTAEAMAGIISITWSGVKPIVELLGSAIKSFKEFVSSSVGKTFFGADREERAKATNKTIEEQRLKGIRERAAAKLKGTPSERVASAFKKTKTPAEQAIADRIKDESFMGKRFPGQTALETNSTINGSIAVSIAGAPDGSTATVQGRSAPQIRVNMLEYTGAQ